MAGMLHSSSIAAIGFAPQGKIAKQTGRVAPIQHIKYYSHFRAICACRQNAIAHRGRPPWLSAMPAWRSIRKNTTRIRSGPSAATRRLTFRIRTFRFSIIERVRSLMRLRCCLTPPFSAFCPTRHGHGCNAFDGVGFELTARPKLMDPQSLSCRTAQIDIR